MAELLKSPSAVIPWQHSRFLLLWAGPVRQPPAPHVLCQQAGGELSGLQSASCGGSLVNKPEGLARSSANQKKKGTRTTYCSRPATLIPPLKPQRHSRVSRLLS